MDNDIEDAREREEKIVKETGKRDYTLLILGTLVILGFYGVIVILLFNKNDPNGIGLYVLGALSSAFSTVIGYFFGSSLSSSKKDEVLNILKRLRRK